MKVEMYVGYFNHTWDIEVVDIDLPVTSSIAEIEEVGRKVVLEKIEAQKPERAEDLMVAFCGLYYVFPEALEKYADTEEEKGWETNHGQKEERT